MKETGQRSLWVMCNLSDEGTKIECTNPRPLPFMGLGSSDCNPGTSLGQPGPTAEHKLNGSDFEAEADWCTIGKAMWASHSSQELTRQISNEKHNVYT